jgi:hypothetical protein
MNRKLLNTYIKSVKKEDGPKIVEFYRKHGFNTHILKGTDFEKNGDYCIYYGVDNKGYFDSRSITMINNAGAKILTLEEANTLVSEKQFPRVMLVSHDNDITTSYKRVVFMKKNNKYMAWRYAETIKESEETLNTVAWSYAWEAEEIKPSRFPFHLTPKNAKKIIDIACYKWQENLANKWGPDIILKKDIIIEESLYLTMRKACTSEQHLVFDKIFGKD